jgi:hypothetical protein
MQKRRWMPIVAHFGKVADCEREFPGSVSACIIASLREIRTKLCESTAR